MKLIVSIWVGSLLALIGFISPAQAVEDYYFYPEFGSFASHNDWAYRAVHAGQANQLGVTGQGVKVAILDDGLSSSAPGLWQKVVAYKDFVPNQYLRPEHGNMVASTIASDANPQVGIGGIAPGVQLVVARVCHRNGCEWDAIRRGILWAVDQGAKVISMSFTGQKDALTQAAQLIAIEKGAVVVASLGNFGCNPYTFNDGINPGCVKGSRVTQSTQATYPVAGMLAVGASNPNGGRVATLGWSSSYGPDNDILAPGLNTSAYDNFAASNGFGGTSSAAPIVAGVAALILSVKPDLSPSEVQAILQSSTSPAIEEKGKVWNSCSKDSTTNNWNCDRVIDSEYPQQYFTGAGVVNAESAVRLAKLWASGELIDKPTINQSGTSLTFAWPGSKADLYLNSKLVAKDVSSGFNYEAFANQSIAVQIKQNGKYSKPAIAVVHQTVVAPPMQISRFMVLLGWGSANDDDFQLAIEPANFNELAPYAWERGWTWASDREYAGIFETDGGQLIPCKGYSQSGAIPTFYCGFSNEVESVSGRFRLIGTNSDLGEYSERVTATNFNLHSREKLNVSVSYLDSGMPIIQWDTAPEVQSYKYWIGAGNLEQKCTTDTSLAPEGLELRPHQFQVQGMSESNCQGIVLADSRYISFTPLPPKPETPTGITVRGAYTTNIEFDVPITNPNANWRIYRSDGLMVPIFSGQSFRIGLQPNEDVNGKTFSYRFAQQTKGTWSDSWSDLSAPVTVSFEKLLAPKAKCVRGRFSSYCVFKSADGSQQTNIEVLDRQGSVLFSQDIPFSSEPQIYDLPDSVSFRYVRFTGTVGENYRYHWYRRGEVGLYPITGKVLVPKNLHQAK